MQAAPPVEAVAPIVVTGHGLRGSRGDKAFDVTIIDRRRIGDSASGRLEDVLRGVAGEQSFRRSDSRSSNATNQSISFRGLGGNASSRGLLVLDGVPQTDPFGGWISFPAFATDQLSSIRVTRGGGSSLWGPGALAGTVELESAGPGDAPSFSASLLGGSRAAIDARSQLIIGNRDGFVSLGASYQRGDGFVPIVAEDRGPVDRAAPYRQWSLSLRGAKKVGPSTELQGALAWFDDRRDRGLAYSTNRGRGRDMSVRLVGNGPTGWSLLAYAQKRRFANQSPAVDAARSTSTLSNDQFAIPSTALGARAEVIPLHGTSELRLGADVRRSIGESDENYQYVAGAPTRFRDSGGRILTAGLFADATRVAGRLTATLSGRVDRWSIGRGRLFQRLIGGAVLTDLAYPDRHGTQISGRVGLAYAVSPTLTFRGAVHRGWRPPTLNELYRPFRLGADITAANPALKPESSVGAEVGGDFALGRGWRTRATLFSARLDDTIANLTVAAGPGSFPEGFVPAGGSYRRRANLDHLATRGLELGVSGQMGAFDLDADYALVDARVRPRAASPLDGLRPAQTPMHSLSATIGWSAPRGWRAALTARATSRQYDDDLNQRVLRAGLTFDSLVSLPARRGLTIQMRGENLTNATVEVARSSNSIIERSTPRTVWLGFTLNN
ncbi:TonB-dependent receptor [Sphingomonas sp. ASV193]|uniref:TonB-dependent receptor n=1 Tax=Sphingomonas sp. ASV193 TaxID=3144405 RepID=UPI0032E85F23